MSRTIPTATLLAAALAAVALPCLAAGSAEPPAVPADIAFEAAAAAPGGTVTVTMTLAPKPGIQINRYPKISLKVAEVGGLVAASEAAVGSDRAPTTEEMESGANYYKGAVDPLVIDLALDPGAAAGEHAVPAKLKYYYCVKASGFCAPKKVDVAIPVTVR